MWRYFPTRSVDIRHVRAQNKRVSANVVLQPFSFILKAEKQKCDIILRECFGIVIILIELPQIAEISWQKCRRQHHEPEFPTEKAFILKRFLSTWSNLVKNRLI